MSNNGVFNITVCTVGILILLIHVVNIAVKKERRRDEITLLFFFLFTILHFTTYLVFTLIKVNYTSDPFIISFYTVFYVMNNVEVFFLFLYARRYIRFSQRRDKALSVLNISLFALFLLLDIINIFTGIFFTAKDGVYLRSGTMILSQGYQFVMFLALFVIILFESKLKRKEKIAFCLYCILPLGAIILQNIFKGYAIAYLSIVISIEVLFLFLSVQKDIELAKEEEKNKDAQIKLMLSQIKPHFVYNSLSAISTLIPLDPMKAQEALDDFTEYLRINISSLTETRLIPFEDELKHIETYVALEKLRFQDRIKVVYDVSTTDFCVPPLTIQPIVENAIKHGILHKIEGGTLTLKTWERADAYVVEIADDGVGFRPEEVNFSKNVHFGLKNIEYRLAKSCHAKVEIKSEVGQGTTVTVTLCKEENR